MSPTDIKDGFAILLIAIVILILIMWLVKFKIKKNNLMLQGKKEDRLRFDFDVYVQDINDLIEEIREEVKNDSLKSEIIEKCDMCVGQLITGESTVDTLIRYKKAICEKKGIRFDVNVKQRLPEGVFTENEYIGLFGNLIDNAIEAAEKTNGPWISFSSKIVLGHWILKFQNSKHVNIRPLECNMITTKTDKENHGIGTKIVEKIVKAHKGEIIREDYGDSFMVLIAINYLK